MAVLDRDACDYATRWLGYRRLTLGLPGAVLAIRDDAELVVEEGFGVADLDTAAPMTPHHVFRVASHSKMFTATVVMRLVERGALRLDDPVSSHLAGAEMLAGVTVRHLLEHAAGLVRDAGELDFWSLSAEFPSGAEVERLALTTPPTFEPYERFKYSNVGYALLGRIVAAVTGDPFETVVRREVIERLGLTSTWPDLDSDLAAPMATGHSAGHAGLPRVTLSHVSADGYAAPAGVCTTAAELLEFAMAHVLGDDRLLTDASKRELHHAHWDVAGSPLSYGLGFMTGTMAGRRVVGHGGAFPGFITATMVSPDDRVGACVLTNAIDGGAATLVGGVLALLAPPSGAVAAAPPVDPDRARRFCGRFMSPWATTDIALLGGNRLVGVNPDLAAPTADVSGYEIVDDHTLRVVEAPGMAAPGELVEVSFDDDDQPVELRRSAGTAVAPDRFRDAFPGVRLPD